MPALPGAKKFVGETLGMCCNSGKIVLLPLSSPPEPLLSLLAGKHESSTDFFLRNLMRYNACFQMTSFGASGECCKNKDWMSTFRVQGQVYHLAGSLLPYCIMFLAEYPRSGYTASTDRTAYCCSFFILNLLSDKRH